MSATVLRVQEAGDIIPLARIWTSSYYIIVFALPVGWALLSVRWFFLVPRQDSVDVGEAMLAILSFHDT